MDTVNSVPSSSTTRQERPSFPVNCVRSAGLKEAAFFLLRDILTRGAFVRPPPSSVALYTRSKIGVRCFSHGLAGSQSCLGGFPKGAGLGL